MKPQAENIPTCVFSSRFSTQWAPCETGIPPCPPRPPTTYSPAPPSRLLSASHATHPPFSHSALLAPTTHPSSSPHRHSPNARATCSSHTLQAPPSLWTYLSDRRFSPSSLHPPRSLLDSGHGTCVRGYCMCSSGWQSFDCGTPVFSCESDCSGHGTCIGSWPSTQSDSGR